jgi:hypothetical protein
VQRILQKTEEMLLFQNKRPRKIRTLGKFFFPINMLKVVIVIKKCHYFGTVFFKNPGEEWALCKYGI